MVINTMHGHNTIHTCSGTHKEYRYNYSAATASFCPTAETAYDDYIYSFGQKQHDMQVMLVAKQQLYIPDIYINQVIKFLHQFLYQLKIYTVAIIKLLLPLIYIRARALNYIKANFTERQRTNRMANVKQKH